MNSDDVYRILVRGPADFKEAEIAQHEFLEGVQRLCTTTDPQEVLQYIGLVTQWLGHMRQVRVCYGQEIEMRRKDLQWRDEAMAAYLASIGLKGSGK